MDGLMDAEEICMLLFCVLCALNDCRSTLLFQSQSSVRSVCAKITYGRVRYLGGLSVCLCSFPPSSFLPSLLSFVPEITAGALHGTAVGHILARLSSCHSCNSSGAWRGLAFCRLLNPTLTCCELSTLHLLSLLGLDCPPVQARPQLQSAFLRKAKTKRS